MMIGSGQNDASGSWDLVRKSIKLFTQFQKFKCEEVLGFGLTLSLIEVNSEIRTGKTQ